VGSTQTGQVDIESIPLNTLSSLCKFSFGGLFVKGRIISVIDGDTFDMAFFVPLMTLGTSRVLGEKREPKVSILPSGRYQQSGFIAKVALRTYGYDAAEKDTTEGKVAKKMMEDKFESIKGIVWCQFIESSIAVDKYGRHLAVVYEDEKRTKIATDYLLEQEKKTRIKMVHPYSGGTKQKF
jgi:endonuclease YncB( thermonuclease family)